MKSPLHEGQAADPAAPSSLRDLLTHSDLRFTPSEEKVVQAVLADYPVAGLGTATSLARRAGVSDPTVVRLVAKLGFDGFSAFQARLLAEVEARLQSPLLMMEAKRDSLSGDSGVTRYLRSVGAALERTESLVPIQLYDRACRLLFEAKGEVFVLGGRFSRNVAGMLASYLVQLRPRVVDLGRLTGDEFDRLVDLGRRDLLIVFDYRRYQSDVVAFARQAAGRGVPVILFTDPWRSPIAEVAEVTLIAEGEAGSPFDTLAPAVAQMEALVAQALGHTKGQERRRMEALERVRTENGVTIGAGPQNERMERDDGI
ncbi:sugar isomerase [Aureimonas endophytica]|uniref:Sugar isomerase n=1 Tax=Aureimonas endophytica TaxID=2027858 RepID=A0A916ZLS1_9HYPH|nr:MurR/RpiR family transcriptional regulator [Aureimonas endophytica]GGE03873.1 sugar isomerase [Aureimonas endophytica]